MEQSIRNSGKRSLKGHVKNRGESKEKVRARKVGGRKKSKMKTNCKNNANAGR